MDTKPLPPDDDWHKEWTLPEEDLPPCITSKRKPGEHRWFRSENVIPTERYLRSVKMSSASASSDHFGGQPCS
jgi:hypothetical protein